MKFRFALSRRAPGPRTASPAFTLIELLIVVAIICLLAALLVPALRAAWGEALRIQCASRLRQISAAYILYGREHKDTFPPMINDDVPADIYRDIEEATGLKMAPRRPADGWGKPGKHWSIIFWPYLKDLDVYQCPADPNIKKRGTEILGEAGGRMASLVDAPPESYALNMIVFRCPVPLRLAAGASWGTEPDLSGWTYTSANDQKNVFGNLGARILMFCGASGGTVGCQFNMPSRTTTLFPQFVRYEWHPLAADKPFEDAPGSGANYLYFGGHVEWSDEFPSRYAWGLDLE